MNKFAVAATLAAGVLTLSACSSDSKDTSEAVVETKSGEVTKEEFYEALKDQNGEAVLQQLVMKEVLSDNYEVTEKEVNKELENMKEKYGKQFDMILKQNNFKSEEDFKDMLRLSLLQEKAAMEDVEISEKEMKDYYEKMKTQVKASHILVDNKDTAKKVKQQLEDGADFQELAKKFSTDKASLKNGGDLGFFGPGEMTAKFEDAAYALEKGEISEPIKTEFGYHIIKKTGEKKAEDVGSFEEEKDTIKRQLASKKIDQTKLQAKMDKMIENANIKVKDEQFKGLFDKPEQPAQGDSGSKEDAKG
ncbi:peptidylprolyl isomerase [Thalassobacillus devorans]|uniref:peptidylprolyl isomerase n=1 Tax=Thalassobacillus devorans TaxID=279813 RepID=UPI00048CE056|nr:peptidylprolyl isomerase [Thalassobacillus devorans]